MKLPLDIYEINIREAGVGCGKSLFVQHKMLEPYSGQKVIEIGFGQGELLDYLLSQGNIVDGIDVGKHAQEVAGENLQKKGYDSAKYTLLRLDVSNNVFPYDSDYFDRGYILETLEHLANPLNTILELKRVIKDGGELVISIPEQEDTFGTHAGLHWVVYPGLYLRNNFRWFLTSCYYRIKKYIKFGGSGIYILENLKSGGPMVDPLSVTKENCYEHEIWNWVNNSEYIDDWYDVMIESKKHLSDEIELRKNRDGTTYMGGGVWR